MDPRGDGSFQVLGYINHNAYKRNLPSGYSVSTTFNVFYISPFGVGLASRMNLFKEKIMMEIKTQNIMEHVRKEISIVWMQSMVSTQLKMHIVLMGQTSLFQVGHSLDHG